ncbi:hypothetical protein JCM10207_008619 [Rhodosporidiobolus poonsookiae]
MRSKLLEIPTGDVGTVHIVYDFVTPQQELLLIDKINAAGGDAPAEAQQGDITPAQNGDGGEVGEGAATAQPGGTASKAGKAWGWKELNGRRSMYWGGTLLASGALVPAPLPPFMDGSYPDVMGRIAETGVYDEWTGGKGKGKERGPNHCLVNEYLPGQGILPHTDGPAYLPCTTTLSLGSHTVLCLRSKPAHLSTPISSSSPSPATATSSDAGPDPPADATPAPSPSEVEKLDLFLPPRSLLVLSSTLYTDWLHGIQPLKADSSEALRGCRNWEGWWEWQAQAAEARAEVVAEAQEEGGEGEEGQQKRESKEEVMARKKLVEAGHGWERGKRVSLTCRRVAKVKKGLFKFG